MKNDLPDSIAPLIDSGQLPIGQILSCPIAGIAAVITSDGITIAGVSTMDPTEAMRHVISERSDHDNGWIFWRLFDQARGFAKTLEHVKVEWNARQNPSGIRTSHTHPLRINSVVLTDVPGRVGLTFCPGKKGDAIYGGAWNRSLDLDLAVINDWGAAAVVTVMEAEEFSLLGVPELPVVMKSQPFRWFHLQVRDSDIPDQRFEQAWPQVKAELVAILHAGGSIVIHCRGGLGRTGMVAALLLVEQGVSPDEAILMVRSARPGAIETWQQELYVRDFDSYSKVETPPGDRR